jgi:hypothetical protein
MKPFNQTQILEKIQDGDRIALFERMSGQVDSIDEAYGALIVSKHFSSCDELADGWEETQHLVAVGLQENLSEAGLDHFIGDIYLVFILQDSVPCTFRQQIEQDKFCCKKYVLDRATKENVLQVLSERIPLLHNWDFSESNSSLVPGANEEKIRLRLTRDIDSSIAKVLRETQDFNAQSSNGLIKKILSVEMGEQ